MEQFIQAERIANAIMMDKSFDGHYLIVEGSKDFKLYQKFFDIKNIKIKEAFGCEKVKIAISILNERQFKKKIGIIDKDFKEILDEIEAMNDLYYTDYHDIEVMIVQTSALETVLNHFCSVVKISDYEKEDKTAIRKTIFELAKQVGYLKLANKIYNLGLIFKPKTVDGNQIKYGDFIDSSMHFKGKEKLIETIINYSRNKSNSLQNKDEILKRFDEISSKDYNLNHLVNGHDLSNIIFILVKKYFSSSNKMLFDFNSIEDSLTLAYEYSEFQKTKLYNDLKLYEANIDYNILKTA